MRNLIGGLATIFFGVMLFFIIKYLTLPAMNLKFISTWVLLWLCCTIVLVGVVLIVKLTPKWSGILVATPTILLVAALLFSISNSPIFSASERYNFVKETVTTTTDSAIFPEIDIEKLPLNDVQEAYKSSETLLGKYPGMGSQFEIPEDFTSQKVGDNLVYAAPLQPISLFRWDKKVGSPGYFTMDRNTGETKFVEQTLKYTQAAPFSSKVERVMRGYEHHDGITDISDEIDESGNLKYVATLYDKSGLGGYKYVTGVLIMDAQTGNLQKYKMNEVPEWVDRVYPTEFFNDYLKYYGEYEGGWWNSMLAKKGITVPTAGRGVLYNEGNCYYYTGWTSIGKDDSVNGIVRMNSKTGKITRYTSYGISEAKAMGVAEGRVQEKKYSSGYPVLVKVAGEETFFIKMRDKNKNIVTYAFVNLKDYKKVGVASTIQEAQTIYLKSLAESMSSQALSGTAMETLTANITGINQTVTDGNSMCYFTMNGSDKIFVIDVKLWPRILFVEPNTQLTINYFKTSEEIISVLKVQ